MTTITVVSRAFVAGVGAPPSFLDAGSENYDVRLVLNAYAATTRGLRSTASEGWHGLRSIVTSEKPTARS